MKISVIVIGIVVLFGSNIFSANKRTDKLYELYNSTSTSPLHKKHIEKILKKIEYREMIRKGRYKGKLSVSEINMNSRFSVKNNITPTADPTFKLGEVYCYPNPAKKINPIFHIESGIADKVELKIYDVSGSLIHESVLSGMPQVIDDGQGPQYAYEYLWDISRIASGVYIYNIKAEKNGKEIKKSGRCAIIK